MVVGVLAYVALVFLLRISGKRTLSKMNAFDFVVTVALGSTLATILLSTAVVLEPDGSFAVVTASDTGNASALADVAGVPDTDHSRNRA